MIYTGTELQSTKNIQRLPFSIIRVVLCRATSCLGILRGSHHKLDCGKLKAFFKEQENVYSKCKIHLYDCTELSGSL